MELTEAKWDVENRPSQARDDSDESTSQTSGHQVQPAHGGTTAHTGKKRREFSFVDCLQSVLDWLKGIHLKYGPDVFDIFTLIFGRMADFHTRWPWWLKYNPVFLVLYLAGLFLMSFGAGLHRCIGQGGPVPDEEMTERRLRIHWVYQFDAYLFIATIGYIIYMITAAWRPQHARYLLRFGGVSALICLVWLAVNIAGLEAMRRKDGIVMNMYITANVSWTVAITALLVVDAVEAGRWRIDFGYHIAAVLFYIVALGLYFPWIWNIYPVPQGRHQTQQNIIQAFGVAATLVFIAGSMVLCVYFARKEMWYLLSGVA